MLIPSVRLQPKFKGDEGGSGRFLKSGGVFLRGEKGEIHPHISPKTFLKL